MYFKRPNFHKSSVIKQFFDKFVEYFDLTLYNVKTEINNTDLILSIEVPIARYDVSTMDDFCAEYFFKLKETGADKYISLLYSPRYDATGPSHILSLLHTHIFIITFTNLDEFEKDDLVLGMLKLKRFL